MIKNAIVKLPSEVIEDFKAEASKRGLKYSQLMRVILMKYIREAKEQEKERENEQSGNLRGSEDIILEH